MTSDKPVQMSLVDGPFYGTITPLEAPKPTWPSSAWDVLGVLRKVTKKQPLLTVHQLGVMSGWPPAEVNAALRHLAAYECARPVREKGVDGWRPGRRARDIYKYWAPR